MEANEKVLQLEEAVAAREIEVTQLSIRAEEQAKQVADRLGFVSILFSLIISAVSESICNATEHRVKAMQQSLEKETAELKVLKHSLELSQAALADREKVIEKLQKEAEEESRRLEVLSREIARRKEEIGEVVNC